MRQTLKVWLGLAAVAMCAQFASASEVETTDIYLYGEASGGVLCFGSVSPFVSQFIAVETEKGESAESVVQKIGKAFPGPSDPYGPIPHGEWRDNLITVVGGPARYFFAGTEVGLGNLPPIKGVTCRYDEAAQTVVVEWEPASTDDVLIFVSTYPAGGWGPDVTPLPAVARIRRSPNMRFKGVLVNVHCYEKNSLKALAEAKEKNRKIFRPVYTPSAMTKVYCPDGRSQEDLMLDPFYGGVVPAWHAWQAKPDAVVLAQGRKDASVPLGEYSERLWERHFPIPDDSPYYQSIKAKDDGVGGVYRKFLGLTPGRSYRITTRMNTLEMDKAEGDWSFTFHAAGHAADATLTPEQMAGTAPLPDGSSGPKAGLVAAFGPETTTLGKWQSVSTEGNTDNALQGDITLAPGMETITVWFRHTAKASTGVGTDWIRLEDLGPASKESSESAGS